MRSVDILVVDDDPVALQYLSHILKGEGYGVVAVKSGKRALVYLERREFALVITDLKMDQVDGMQVLRWVKMQCPQTEVILLTAFSTVESAVEALKAGAYNYILKPFQLEESGKVLHDAIQKYQLAKETLRLEKEDRENSQGPQIITQNRALKGLLETANQVAATDTNVVICGESGTGKELFAKYIHNASDRNQRTMLSINCGAFSEELLTNELFGHVKGAFTGADTAKKGLVEMADGSTLFLDEITEMPLSMQVKFLRVLQEQEVIPVGGTKPVKVNVRFVAATNRELDKEVKAGHFRQDLFYRINVVSLTIPPLSERKDDIALLVQCFLKKYNSTMRKNVKEVSQEVLDILQSYDFPGNVRELENIVERGVALTNGEVMGVDKIPEDLRSLDVQTFRKSGGKYATIEDVEKTYIEWILQETGYNKTEAAKALGIDRVSLWRKIKKFDLE